MNLQVPSTWGASMLVPAGNWYSLCEVYLREQEESGLEWATITRQVASRALKVVAGPWVYAHLPGRSRHPPWAGTRLAGGGPRELFSSSPHPMPYKPE